MGYITLFCAVPVITFFLGVFLSYTYMKRKLAAYKSTFKVMDAMIDGMDKKVKITLVNEDDKGDDDPTNDDIVMHIEPVEE